jgi:thiopurine S-methyltransferase
MDPAFWRARWQSNDIGFHQPHIHELLQEHWPGLKLPPGSTVFVPLCGKSLDMVWLAQQGHRVIGAELSELAIDDFFAERGLSPTTTTTGDFVVKSADAYEIWRGDIFELPNEATAGVAGVYDRAALIALPPSLRRRYAEKLTALLPSPAPILLITLDYDRPRCRDRPSPCRAGRFMSYLPAATVAPSSNAAKFWTVTRTSSSAGSRRSKNRPICCGATPKRSGCRHPRMRPPARTARRSATRAGGAY